MVQNASKVGELVVHKYYTPPNLLAACSPSVIQIPTTPPTTPIRPSYLNALVTVLEMLIAAGGGRGKK